MDDYEAKHCRKCADEYMTEIDKLHRDNAILIAANQEKRDELAALRADNERLVEVLKNLVDDEPCSFDHHGYCQTHGVTMPCNNEVAKSALSASEGEKKEGE